MTILWLGHHNLGSSLRALAPKVVNAEGRCDALVDNAEEASADDNDDGCPGNAGNGLENENYVRESAIDN